MDALRLRALDFDSGLPAGIVRGSRCRSRPFSDRHRSVQHVAHWQLPTELLRELLLVGIIMRVLRRRGTNASFKRVAMHGVTASAAMERTCNHSVMLSSTACWRGGAAVEQRCRSGKSAGAWTKRWACQWWMPCNLLQSAGRKHAALPADVRGCR